MAKPYRKFVYKFTFPDGTVYIGSTHDIKQRWLGNGVRYKPQKVYAAISKFGWDNIKREVLLETPDGELFDKICQKMETELIRAYGDKAHNDPVTVENARTFWIIGSVRKPAAEWCEIYKRTYSGVLSRMEKYNISPHCALTLPPVPKGMEHHAEEYWKSCGCEFY